MTPKSRLGGLDGIRAVAAILIIIHHAGFNSGATFNQPATQYLGRADIGVAIFFVLSGFLLYRPFVARLLDGGESPSARVFWLKRFLRIYPAYWVALVIMLILGGIAVRGPSGFFFAATLTHSYHPNRGISGITQSWSLVAEVAFYLLLPFWHALTVRVLRGRAVNVKAVGVLGGLVLVYSSSLAFRVGVAALDPSFRRITPQWLAAQSDHFALGMALALAACWATRNSAVAHLVARVSRPAGWWYLAALAGFWFTATQLQLAVGMDSAGFWREGCRQFMYGVIAVCVVLPMAWGGGMTTRIGRALDSRPLRYLGTVSYGIYLWHQWVLTKMMDWLDWPLFEGHFWGFVIGGLIGSTILATASLRLVEEPLARLAPKLVRWWS